MAWSIADVFPPWGDEGNNPGDNFQYDGGDTVDEAHLDYLWAACGQLENEARAALEDIDSNKDGIVDEADAITGGGALLGDLTDDQSTPITVWDDTNKEIPDSALGQIDTSTLAADDGTGNIATTALAADSGNTGEIDTTALQADADNDGLIDTVNIQPDHDGDGLVEGLDESAMHDGGVREVDAAELAGALGTSGQVLRTDGAAVSWVDFNPTGRSWDLIGSKTVSSAKDIAVKNLSAHDQILVSLDLGLTAASTDWKLRLNADTGGNYNYIDDDGTRQTGKNGVRIIDVDFGDTDVTGTIHVSGRWTNNCVFACHGLATAAGKSARQGQNTSIVSPLDSVHLSEDTGSSSATGTINVYGRNTP